MTHESSVVYFSKTQTVPEVSIQLYLKIICQALKMVKKTKQWQTSKHRCGPISKTTRLLSRDLWLANPPIVSFSANFINPTTVPRGALCFVPRALSTTGLNEEPATKDLTSCLAEFLIAVIESTQGQRASSLLLNLQIFCTRSSLLCQTSQDWTRLQLLGEI